MAANKREERGKANQLCMVVVCRERSLAFLEALDFIDVYSRLRSMTRGSGGGVRERLFAHLCTKGLILSLRHWHETGFIRQSLKDFTKPKL
jgi:hypothetical protein